MSHPGDRERRKLDDIAFDLREAFEERGYRVDVALGTDAAFGSGDSRAALMRDLAYDVVGRAAGRVGLGFGSVNGRGRELLGERHRYRVRKAQRGANNAIIITVSTESALGAEEEETLFPLESWVFGWIPDCNGLISEVFVAEILGIEPGRPGQLVLGRALSLGDSDPLGGGFTPSDEDLDLGEDDEDTGNAAGDLGA